MASAAWAGYAVLVNESSTQFIVDWQWWGLLPVAIFGGLLPDIDHPGSTFGKRIRPVSTMLSLFSHRGVTHSIWAIAGMMYLLAKVGLPIGADALIVGALSHLVADATTPAGIRPFWPLGYKFRLRLF